MGVQWAQQLFSRGNINNTVTTAHPLVQLNYVKVLQKQDVIRLSNIGQYYKIMWMTNRVRKRSSFIKAQTHISSVF